MSNNQNITISEQQSQSEQSSSQEKEIYFIIITPKEKNINFNDLKFKSEILPQKIYSKSIEKVNGQSIEHNVFKLNVIKNKEKEKEKEKEKKKNSGTKYDLPYIIGDDAYDIIFSVKENTFVYETELLKGNKYIDNIIKESIEQNNIPLYDKLDIFLEALEKNNENDKIEKLYGGNNKIIWKEKKILVF